MNHAPDNASVEIVEVGPRDGFQPIGPFIPTETKVAIIERLVAAGLHRIEIGSFVSASAVPQLRDTPELLAACALVPGLILHSGVSRSSGLMTMRMVLVATRV